MTQIWWPKCYAFGIGEISVICCIGDIGRCGQEMFAAEKMNETEEELDNSYELGLRIFKRVNST